MNILKRVGMRKLLWIFAVGISLTHVTKVAAQTPAPASLCQASGYVLGFFNGVWNDEAGALNGLQALKAVVGPTWKNEPVAPELFYNHTGAAVGSNFLQDIAEVFIQRAREIDASGSLEQRIELVWEAAFNNDHTFLDRIASSITGAAGVIDALYTDISTKAVAGWSLLLASPPTAIDLSRHRARLDALAIERKKLMLVAHSQGNLFINEAYDYIAPKIGASSVAAAHVAPASSTLRGPYLLADIDLVINGLRAQGIGSVPSVNLNLPVSRADLSGHQLVPTYLDGTRPGRAAVLSMISGGLDGLTTPTGGGSAVNNSGFFTVTMTWDGAGDVDLHTFEPSGTHVFYAAKAGISGFLDVDNVISNGPEHYFATCDAATLQLGTYRIGLNNFARATGRTATVQVSSAQRGELFTKSLGVGAERGSGGDSVPIPVVNVVVSRDTNGVYSAAITP